MRALTDHLQKIVIALAVLGYLASFALSYRSYGMAEGLNVGAQELEEFKTRIGYEDTIHFSGSSMGTYDHLALEYGWLSWFFGISAIAIVAGRLLNSIAILALVISGFAQLGVLYQLRQLIRSKMAVDELFWAPTRNQFASQTITYDWIFVVLASLLVLLILVLLIATVQVRKGFKTA